MTLAQVCSLIHVENEMTRRAQRPAAQSANISDAAALARLAQVSPQS